MSFDVVARIEMRRLTVVVTEMLDALEVGQTIHPSRDKLAHGEDSISVRVEGGENGVDNLLCLLRMHLHRARLLPPLLVVHAVDRFQLVDVEDAVAIQVVQVKERLNVCSNRRESVPQSPVVHITTCRRTKVVHVVLLGHVHFSVRRIRIDVVVGVAMSEREHRQ